MRQFEGAPGDEEEENYLIKVLKRRANSLSRGAPQASARESGGRGGSRAAPKG